MNDQELIAIDAMVAALEPLSRPERKRALDYVMRRMVNDERIRGADPEDVHVPRRMGVRHHDES